MSSLTPTLSRQPGVARAPARPVAALEACPRVCRLRRAAPPPAAQRLSRGRLLVCAARKGGKSEGEEEGHGISEGGLDTQSLDEQALAGQSFQSLAKVVAKQLGKEMAGQEDTLANWIKAGAEEAGEQASQAAASPLKKAASIAGSVLGLKPQAQSGGGTEKSLPEQAAEYLGVNLASVTGEAVKKWLGKAGTSEREDTRMVAAVVLRLLQSFERYTGEHFDGRDQQLTGVWRLAQETFGGSWSKGLVTALVKAYLRVPGRG